MHDAAMQWACRWAPRRPVQVLDVGGRNINGTPRGAFDPESSYTVIDLEVGDGVDIVADFATYKGDPVDVVVCMEVAEHAPAWPNLLGNARDHLHLGGMLIFTAAGPGRAPHSAVDGGPLRDGEWYENINPTDLDRRLSDLFDTHQIDVAGDDVRAVAWR